MYFVGVTLLKFTSKEVGHWTVGTWNKLYDHYKRNYNMKVKGMLFKEEEIKQEESLEWFDD